MPSRHRPSKIKSFPPLLHRLARAAEIECPEGHAEALEALIEIAWHRVPGRGLFEPVDDDEMCLAIDRVAKEHLGLGRDRRRFHKALEAVNLSFEQRNSIEVAAASLRATSDSVYYLAGLASALVFVSMRD